MRNVAIAGGTADKLAAEFLGVFEPDQEHWPGRGMWRLWRWRVTRCLGVSEVAAPDVSDVNLAEQTVLIRHGKTDQERKGTVRFPGKPTTERIQARLLNSRLAEGALFRAVNKAGGVQGRAGV